MYSPKWGMFFDFHTMPSYPDVGKNFDFNQLTDLLSECGVDYVVFAAKCNSGMAYYDTKVGTRHPSLNYDLFGRMVETCKAKGIAVGAYLNVGLSHEQALLHRDWAILTPEGYTYKPNPKDPFFRQMCFNSDYGDYIVQMTREVVRGYDIAGLFFDCMNAAPCVGVECIRKMKQMGMDWSNKDEQLKFARMSVTGMMSRLSTAVKELNDDLLMFFNGPPFEDQRDYGNYLEYECLPSWGCDSRLLGVQYLRNLKKPAVNMTGRFHGNWGDFGGLCNEADLEFSCAVGVANGVRTTIGDHFHPRGDMYKPVFDRIKKVYHNLQRYEEWLSNARPVTDIAAVIPRDTFENGNVPLWEKLRPSSLGCGRMLSELKAQFDIYTESLDFSGHKVVILSDHACLPESAVKQVKDHLNGGGSVISAGWGGLRPDGKEFALPQEWGIHFKGDSPYDPAYIKMTPKMAGEIPDMPLTLYDRGVAVTADANTRILAEIIAPYCNQHWDGEHSNLYLPPDKATDQPAITQHGRVVHFAFPLFTSYYNHAYTPMRDILGHVLNILLPEPLIRTPKLPAFVRAYVTRQPGRRMVHLLSYLPERRGANMDIVEEAIELRDVAFDLRLDEKSICNVYQAPNHLALPHSIENGYVHVSVPLLKGYTVIVFEEEIHH